MLELFLAASMAVGISAFCSVAEAVLYSVPWSHIENLRKKGKASGNILYALRTEVEKPIAAVLSLNTIANTLGASIAGASAAKLFGQEMVSLFALIFTVVILIFSEILPKTIGVVHAKALAPLIARPLQVLVFILAPLVKMLGLLSGLVQRKSKGPEHTEEDIYALVTLSRRSGVLQPDEELAIKNILGLNKHVVADIMTPRTVVFSRPVEMTIEESKVLENIWPHSRIPVYADDPENIVGIVYRRDVLHASAKDETKRTLGEMMKPVRFVLASLPLDKLLANFLESRIHLAVALDEWGGVAGVVSLEDVLEEILGKEIIDETDEVADLRELALRQRQSLTAHLKNERESANDSE